ncbi:hypothetical protein BH10PSE4_BH10PSE4_17050 [soil metagenome]
MTRRLLNLALVASVGASLCACATNTNRFEWGGYESSLYAYTKKPELRANYRVSLEKAVEKGRQTDRVAPGLLAELGYLYLEDGDAEHAVPLFEEEMRRFPEAKPFMTSVIARAKGVSQSTSPTPEVKS